MVQGYTCIWAAYFLKIALSDIMKCIERTIFLDAIEALVKLSISVASA